MQMGAQNHPLLQQLEVRMQYDNSASDATVRNVSTRTRGVVSTSLAKLYQYHGFACIEKGL